MEGVIVLDKPCGISSHDAVQRLRRLTGERRIGHLGTLDPLGTGVLPLAIGKATRLARFFLRHDREYSAVARLGFSTTTYDRDGEPTSTPVAVRVTERELEEVLTRFRGCVMQTPPPISAKKIGGVPAYELTRRNQPPELAPVEVEIEELTGELIAADLVRLTVRCSAGTYVRSLAHDIGAALGCGAHVAELRRTAMGEFSEADARTLEELATLRDDGRLDEALIAPEKLLPEMPARRVDAAEAARIAHGRDFRVNIFAAASPAKLVKAIGPDGRLLAIGEIRLPSVYHPAIVF